MNKIKVCQFVCGLEGGGAEQVIYNYCSKMDREEYEFYLVYQHKACKKNLKEFESLNFKLFNIPSKVSGYYVIDNPILDDTEVPYTGTISIPGGNINKYIVIYFDKEASGSISGTFEFLSNYYSGGIYV